MRGMSFVCFSCILVFKINRYRVLEPTSVIPFQPHWLRPHNLETINNTCCAAVPTVSVTFGPARDRPDFKHHHVVIIYYWNEKYEELTFLATLSVVTRAGGTTATDDTDTTYYEQNSNGHTDANYNWQIIMLIFSCNLHEHAVQILWRDSGTYNKQHTYQKFTHIRSNTYF